MSFAASLWDRIRPRTVDELNIEREAHGLPPLTKRGAPAYNPNLTEEPSLKLRRPTNGSITFGSQGVGLGVPVFLNRLSDDVVPLLTIQAGQSNTGTVMVSTDGLANASSGFPLTKTSPPLQLKNAAIGRIVVSDTAAGDVVSWAG